MRALIALAILIFLQAIAYAVPFNETIGPYKVSFDMGFNNYYITGDPWKASESLSGTEKYEFGKINVFKDRNHEDGIAIILIKHNFEDQKYLSPLEYVEWGRDLYDTTTTRMIDGVLGAVGSLELDNGITIYTAEYHPTFDPKRLNLTILSNYPWDEGTLQLLKTIHIEEKVSEDGEMMEQAEPTDRAFKILIDDETEQTITTDNPLELEEGYVLQINHIDVNGNKVYLDLLKDSKVIDSKIVSPSKDRASDEDKIYRYKKDIGNATNITLIEVHFKNAFRGNEMDLGTISSVMQVSEN